MRKQTIHWIIALMSISSIGIIATQWYWLRQSIAQKEAEFEGNVKLALNNIADAIDIQEAKMMLSDTDSLPVEVEAIVGNQVDYQMVFSFSDDSDAESKNMQIRKKVTVIADGNEEDVEEIIWSDEGNNFIFPSEGDDQSTVDQQTVIRYYQSKKDQLDSYFGQLVVEYAQSDVSVAERLKNIDLDSIIRTELDGKGISTAYSYKIRENENDSVILAHVIHLHEGSGDQEFYSSQLFASPRGGHLGTLLLQPDNKFNYIWKSLWFTFLSSILLTMVIIFTFAYTIRIILRQKKISSIKSDFINNMTHEFKTPIATISLAIDSIEHPDVSKQPEQLHYFTNIIRKENKRMNRQIEHVLEMAVIEKGELQLNEQSMDVHEIIQEVVDHSQLAIQKKSGSIETVLHNDSAHIIGDRMHFYNVLRNLVDNSIKYSKTGLAVKIATSLSPAWLEIAVSDNGIGMSKETQARIFDRFYRQNKGNLHTTKGFGLGLSYVKAIVELMKGQIIVESELAKGTIIRIKLPRTHES